MSNIQHRESDALLVALTPVIQEFVDAAAQSAGDFHTVECAGASAFRKLRVMLMTTGIKVSAQCAERNYHCPECAVPLHVWERRERTIETTECEARHTALRYRCPKCATFHTPLEDANGLAGSHFTTMAQGLIGQTSAQVAYAATSAALQERGIRVSAKEVDRAARDVASWRREEESAVVSALFDRGAQAQTEEGPTPRGVVSSVFDWSRWKRGGAVMICVDGAKVRSPHQGKDGLEWFEARVGVIAPITPVANKAPVHQTGSHNKAYLGGVVSADALFDRLKAVWEQGPHQDCSVVFVADGATRMALRGYGTVCVCTSRAVLRCWTFITRGSTSPAQRLPCYLVG